MGPVTTAIADQFSIGLGVVGVLAGTVFFAGLVLGKVLVRRLAAAGTVEGTARLASLASGAGNALFAVSPVLAGLYAGRLVAGIGLGLAVVLGPAIARQLGGTRLTGVFGASVTLGIAAALGLGSLLREAGVDWRLDFAISALLGLSAIPLLPSRTGVPDPPRAGRGFGRRALRTANGWRLTLLFTAVLGIPYALGAWLIHFLVEVDGIATGLAGVLAFAMYGLLATTREVGARLARPRRIGSLTGLAALAGAVGLLMLATGSEAAALPGLLLAGVGLGLPYATMYDEAARSYPQAPVAPIAFFTMGGNLFPLVAVPLVGSALASGEGELAFAVLAAVLGLAGLASLRPAVPAP